MGHASCLGVFTGKTWGDKSQPPVLCLHGILDNCNSFDRLIPLLPSCFFYVCLDFPGHGLSSHYPLGFLNDSFLFVSIITRTVNHFRLEKFALLCHSFGGQIGSMYASLFSGQVTKLIMLDSVGFFYVNTPSSHYKRFKQSLLILLKVEHALATKTQPKYKYEDLLQKLILGRRDQDSTLTRESVEILIKRNISKVPGEDLYYYTVDQHLKHYSHFTPNTNLEQLKYIYTYGIKCKVLILECRNSYRIHNSENYLALKSIWKNNVRTKIYQIDGNHDIHLNEADKVSKYVSLFLLEADSVKSKL